MAKGCNDVTPIECCNGSSLGKNFMFIAGIVGLGYLVVQSAYENGRSTAKQILRRHDKDVRTMEKRYKRHLKEKEREEERRAGVKRSFFDVFKF